MRAKTDQNFRFIIVYSTAVAFGFMIATIEALGVNTSGFSFHPTWHTLVAFGFGALLPWLAWRLVFASTPANRRSRMAIFAAVLGLLGLLGFFYPMRYVASEKMADLMIGFALAVGALSIAGGLVWLVKRYLEADERRGEIAERRGDPKPRG